ncbi:MAG: pyrroloquinoline quinone precursor peptide PqqA [Gammaproteobacteria bacterium]|nr:pyrroloquinoline quinone precursor peptide PqqA [Gammaproteobacteria bacterium]
MSCFLKCSLIIIIKGVPSMWTKPAYKDIRVGFEVTMYCYSR